MGLLSFLLEFGVYGCEGVFVLDLGDYCVKSLEEVVSCDRFFLNDLLLLWLLIRREEAKAHLLF